MSLTIDDLRRTLDTYGGGLLRRGPPCGHSLDELRGYAARGFAGCHMCVRELRTIALLGPDRSIEEIHQGWTDRPDDAAGSPTDHACQQLSDASWSSAEARTEACLPLALLSEHTAPGGWTGACALGMRRVLLPIALRSAAAIHPDVCHQEALREAATRCESGVTSVDAAAVVYDAAAVVFRGIDAAADRGVIEVCDAAYELADSSDAADAVEGCRELAAAVRDLGADPDEILRISVALLIASHEGPDPWASARVQQAVTACGVSL